MIHGASARDDQLVEEYGYANLELEAPLADADFDPKNPEYHFQKRRLRLERQAAVPLALVR